MYDYSEWESESPRGRMQIIQRLNDEELKYNDVVKNRMYECTLCGYCKFKCPTRVRTVDAIKAARSQLVRTGIVPEPIESIGKAVTDSRNIFHNPQDTRMDWIDYMALKDSVNIGGKADVVYFTGCSTILAGRAMSIAVATTAILNTLGFKWTLLGEQEWCCGNPLLSAGQLEGAEAVAKHNIEVIKKSGAQTVVTSCPGCFRVLADEYPDIIGDHGLDVKHITQVIADGVDDGKIKFKKTVNKRVTYHDPCELGRLMAVFEPPRKVLENVPGLKLLELNRTRNFTYCCGAGGLMKASFPDLAMKMGIRKLDEAHDVNAEVLVSSCQTCKINILDAILEKRDSLKTIDIAELVAWSMDAKEMKAPRARRFVNFL
jgi:heterodisulfide reductase subunit D